MFDDSVGEEQFWNQNELRWYSMTSAEHHFMNDDETHTVSCGQNYLRRRLKSEVRIEKISRAQMAFGSRNFQIRSRIFSSKANPMCFDYFNVMRILIYREKPNYLLVGTQKTKQNSVEEKGWLMLKFKTEIEAEYICDRLQSICVRLSDSANSNGNSVLSITPVKSARNNATNENKMPSSQISSSPPTLVPRNPTNKKKYNSEIDSLSNYNRLSDDIENNVSFSLDKSTFRNQPLNNSSKSLFYINESTNDSLGDFVPNNKNSTFNQFESGGSLRNSYSKANGPMSKISSAFRKIRNLSKSVPDVSSSGENLSVRSTSSGSLISLEQDVEKRTSKKSLGSKFNFRRNKRLNNSGKLFQANSPSIIESVMSPTTSYSNAKCNKSSQTNEDLELNSSADEGLSPMSSKIRRGNQVSQPPTWFRSSNDSMSGIKPYPELGSKYSNIFEVKNQSISLESITQPKFDVISSFPPLEDNENLLSHSQPLSKY